MATSDEIRDKALKRLGILSTGQTTQAEIKADLDAAYTEVYAALSARNLTNWDESEEIPDEYVWPLVALVAYARIDEYSVPNDRYQRIGRDWATALAEIRTLQASNVYKTPTAVYY
jgi:hypothetical protein